MEKKNVKKNTSGKRMFGKKLKLCIALLILGGIVGLIIGAVNFFNTEPVKRNASMTIEFTYEEAAQNKMPNGEPFTLDGIERDDIINAALTKLEYQDTYTPDQIRNSINISGSFPEDVLSRIQRYDSVYDYQNKRDVQMNNYYPTVYTITLYDDFDPGVSTVLLEDILREIVTEYKSYFLSNYTYVYSNDTKNNVFSLDKVDYRQQLSLIRGRMNIIKEYASYLFSKDMNYTYKGLNFHDLVVRCDDIEDTSLTGLEAIIIMKAYSKDPDRLKKMYQYNIEILENQLTRKKENLDSVNTLRDNYEMDDILYVEMGDSSVKIDGNSSGTYEKLTSRKIALTEEITNTNTSIAKLKEYLNDLNAGKATSQEIEKAEAEISAANSKLSDLEDTFKEMIKAYNDYKVTADNIIINDVYYTSPSLFSMSYIKRAVKYCIPTCMFAFLIFGIYMIISEKKKLNV